MSLWILLGSSIPSQCIMMCVGYDLRLIQLLAYSFDIVIASPTWNIRE